MKIGLFFIWILFFVRLGFAAEPTKSDLLFSTDVYTIFGVDPKTSDAPSAFKSAYRQLLKKYHPDLNPNDADAAEISKRVNALMAELKKVNFNSSLVSVARVAPPRARPSSSQNGFRTEQKPRPQEKPKEKPTESGSNHGGRNNSQKESSREKREEPKQENHFYDEGRGFRQEEANTDAGFNPEGREFYSDPPPHAEPRGSNYSDAQRARRPTLNTNTIHNSRIILGLRETLEQTASWEALSNDGIVKSPYYFEVEHLEIPTSALNIDFIKNLDPKLKAALLINNGEKIRWIMHPDDRTYGYELEKALKEKNIPFTRGTRFFGRYTASRSLFIIDPQTEAEFSVKTSTDNAGGRWQNKAQTAEDAQHIRMQDTYLEDVLKRNPPKNFSILRDVGAVTLDGLDRAMVVRSLEPLKDGFQYLPGFAALNSDLGRQIALKNRASDTVKFWEQNLIDPLAKASAEMAAKYGESYESSHAQQFLIELDKNQKPTGRIVFRDTADVFLQKEFFQGTAHENLVRGWENGYVTSGKMDISLGLFHGTKMPSWMNEQKYEAWGRRYFQVFEDEFARYSGVPKESLARTRIEKVGNVFAKEYSNSGAEWQTHYKNAMRGPSGAGEICMNWFKNIWRGQ